MPEAIPACMVVDDVPANATYWWRAQMTAFGFAVPEEGWGRGWREQAQAPFWRPEHARRLADLVEEFDLRGKCTLLPCPAGLGRLDRSVRRYGDAELAELLEIVRTRFAPRFNITPEVMTHSLAFDVDREALRPHSESAWMTHLATEGRHEELADYIGRAYEILHAVGIHPHGCTIGGIVNCSGLCGKKSLALGDGCDALAKAVLEVERRFEPGTNRSFIYTGAPPRTERSRKTGLPEPVYDAPDGGQVSQIFSLDDVGLPAIHGRAEFDPAVDRWITPDLADGEFVRTIEAGSALAFMVHPQTMMSLHTGQGFDILQELLERLRRRYGGRLRWMTPLEMIRWREETDAETRRHGDAETQKKKQKRKQKKRTGANRKESQTRDRPSC